MTRGIYHYDSDMFEALWNTPIKGKLPIDLLYRLPEWCVYIEAPPGYEIDGHTLLGWFTHLEYDVGTGRPELRFVFDFKNILCPFMLHMTEPTLTECVKEALTEGWRQAKKAKNDYTDLPDADDTAKRTKEMSETLSHILSIILYLCSVSADISDLRGKQDRPANPTPQKTKKGMRIFPLPGASWLVGYRIGATLRLSSEDTPVTGVTVGEDAEKVRASPRPHVRSAHWHSYWTGPKSKPAERKMIVKWLPPVPVSTGELVPTIRKVE